MASSTAVKLGIKPGSTALVLGIGVTEAIALIGELPAGARIAGEAASPDLVIRFAHSFEGVRQDAAGDFDRLAPADRYWIAYRKGARRAVSDPAAVPLHRDTLQAALAAGGFDGVTLISIDETWSAMRVKRV